MKKISAKTWRRWGSGLLLLAIAMTTFFTGQSLQGSAVVNGGDYGMVFLILLYLNIFFALILGIVVFRNLFRLWLDRHNRRTGSKFRTRMVSMFIALSLLPTLILAILSVNFLNRGVDTWFSDQISTALENSLAVSRAYYHENQRTVRHDAESIVRNRNVTPALALEGADSANSVLEVERRSRGLDVVTLLRSDGTRLAQAGELPFDPIPDLSGLKEGTNKALLVTNEKGDRVRAFVRLSEDLYLSTGHWIDRQILAQMETIESAYVHYHKLRAAHGLLKSNHTVTLAMITLLLTLAAIWSGFRIADSITDPITELVIGTRKVASGDLSVSLSVTGDDELATLMAAFNAMTKKLNENREELQSTNALLEERRRFMAAIVRNISSGVICVNQFHEITLMNPAAGAMIGIDPIKSIGHKLEQTVPEEVLSPLSNLWSTLSNPDRTLPPPLPGVHSIEQMTLGTQIQTQGSEKPLTLMMRVTPREDSQGSNRGFIATFDDISEVLVAQRTSAWSEVARRIAHEIKNPLTPIHLWSQRMRRKYLKDHGDTPPDWRILDEGTSAIINQVEALKVLVNEFSTFSRLPRPQLHENDFHGTIREVLLLHSQELKGIQLKTAFAPGLKPFAHDPGQMKQVLTNLITNALAAMRDQNKEQNHLTLTTSLPEGTGWVLLQVADSGPGIPASDRTRVFEPYFTTKKKGTGLGLAIVKKIIEDHGGTIRLRESEWGGILVDIQLPLGENCHDGSEETTG
ncbi:MAG: HAMP domain-containing protein [Magnetococcales bacterium]|nr:HAMP domain-containing protein [Magnetococcales bacterium]